MLTVYNLPLLLLCLFLVLHQNPKICQQSPPDHDLAPVFSKHHAVSLPPHRPYDYTFNLLEGAPLPSGKL